VCTYLLSIGPPSHAEGLPALRLRHISINDGLSQNLVSCILQDSRGYMWFGTKDGLNRFDGIRFTIFYNDPTDSTSISPGEISSILEDRFGNIWVVSSTLNRFDRLNETFSHFRHNANDPTSIASDRISRLCESTVGGDTILWIGTWGAGLDRILLTSQFAPTKAMFQHLAADTADDRSLSNSTIRSLCVDRRGVLWVGTQIGLSAADLTHGASHIEFSRYGIEPPPSGGLADVPNALFESRDGSLWIGSRSGISRLPPNRIDRFQYFPHHHEFPASWHAQISSIIEDGEGTIWLAYLGGIAIFQPKSETYTWYANAGADGTEFAGVMSVYRDRGDKIWFGTAGWGVFQLDERAKPFRYERATEQRDVIPHLFAADLRAESGAHSKGSTAQIGKPLRDALAQDFWSFPLIDRVGRIWVGTLDGLFRFDTPSSPARIYRHRPSDATSLAHDDVLAMHEDRAGRIWILNGGVFSLYMEKSDSFIHHIIDTSAHHSRIFSLQETADGIFWLSWINEKGFLQFNPRSGAVRFFRNTPADPSSLSNNLVPSLLLDPRHPDSILWVGTGGGGLNRLDLKSGKFSRFLESDGLPNNFVNGILGEENGTLWISTNRGLSKFNPEVNGPQAFRNYDVSDGLQSNEFNQGSCYKARTGEMFFWGIGGTNIFYAREIIDNPIVPPIVLTDFRLSNRTVRFAGSGSPLLHPVGESEEIVISYRENIISFEYAALNFGNPQKNQYMYKLENFFDSWVDAGNNRLASFTNLDPGTYIFRVKGSNSDGVWNETGASIRLIVTPPPWRTWWAYLFYVVVGMSVLYGWRRYDINRIRMRNELKLKQVETESLRELDEMKSKFFANISHEFRTPLTMIVGPVEQMLETETDGQRRKKLTSLRVNAGRLLKLINQLLDLSRLESGKTQLRVARGDFLRFLKGIAMSFDSLAERRQIVLQFRSQEEKVEFLFDHDAIEKIFNNLISNAFKFTGEGGIVSIDVAINPKGNVEVTVSDTGIGIPADKVALIFDRFYQVDSSSTRAYEGTGIGLALVKELIDRHHGTITATSTEGQGSAFTVHLPTADQTYADDETVTQPITEHQLERKEDFETVTGPGTEDAPAQSEDETIVLVVEDNAEVRAYVCEHLQGLFRVVEAADGEEGVNRALSIIPDLVISDLMMPKKNGYELCLELKSNEKTSHVPVILLTAKAGEEDKLAGLHLGADDYLVKPFSSKELVARVQNLIAIRRKLREHFRQTVILKPSEVTATSIDREFLAKALAVVEKYLGDEEFTVEKLGHELAMSRMQLHRKLVALTNQPASTFIRTVRLQRAAALLDQSAGTVSEIAFQAGFGSPAYFTKCFREEFGILPSEYSSRKKP